MNKFYNIFLVSDSTGETLDRIFLAIKAQFNQFNNTIHHFSFFRTSAQVKTLIEKCKKSENPIIIYTLVDITIIQEIKREASHNKYVCFGILDTLLPEFEKVLGKKANHIPSGQHALNKEYYKRISAMQFSIEHDDGQKPETILESDIIVLGISRTSKTPTTIYLANKGFKSANIPLISDRSVPEEVLNEKTKTVVGLIADASRLQDIRKTRLNTLSEEKHTSYVDIEKIKEEIEKSKILFKKYNIPVIDVTRKSVEETAASIIKIHEIKNTK